jgi:hypothetical protein
MCVSAVFSTLLSHSLPAWFLLFYLSQFVLSVLCIKRWSNQCHYDQECVMLDVDEIVVIMYFVYIYIYFFFKYICVCVCVFFGGG